MVFVVKSVGIHEVSVLTAELLRLFVHHLYELIGASAADVVRKRKSRVVARGHHHAVEQVFDAHFFADVLVKMRH